MPPEQAEIRQWLVKARRDWALAEKAKHPPVPAPDLAGFHCEQAAEKTLKAYLMANGVPFEKIHDLRQLLKLCATADSAFLELREAVEPLTVYAVAFRYPGPADPTPERVEAALQAVTRIWNFVTQRLSPNVLPVDE